METMRRVRNPPLLTAAMITVLFEDPPSELLGGPGEELELGAADVMTLGKHHITENITIFTQYYV